MELMRLAIGGPHYGLGCARESTADFGGKIEAGILSLYCRSLCGQSNKKKCYKHVALEMYKILSVCVI